MTLPIEQYRRALRVHCYRMLGSYTDAEDLVQETMMRAWTARGSYDESTGELGLSRWLHRIATNACLDFLKSASRRVVSASSSFSEISWIQPIPDRMLDDETASKETIALGFLALIQMLPPQQRAVYLCREVLGWTAAETADALDVTVTAGNSALQRARETVDKNAATHPIPDAPTDVERAVLAAFIDVHEHADSAAAIAMMREDIRTSMPPTPGLFVGRAVVRELIGQAFDSGMGDWHAIPAWANRQPAAACYLRAPGDTAFRLFKIDVLRIVDGLVAEITTFDGRGMTTAFGIDEVLAGA